MEKMSCLSQLASVCLILGAIAGTTAKEYALLEEKKVIAVAGKDKRVILSCPYTRRIPVVWRKDGKVVHSNRNTVLSYGTLTMRPVSLAVEGLYECKSEDLFDHGYRAVFNVSINETPRILQRNRRHSYTNGSTADYLNCKANGKPKPDVFWINEKGFSAINPPTITRISETTLKVANLKNGDSRVLICVAQNMHGRVKVKFKVGPETKAATIMEEKKETKEILSTTVITTTKRPTTERRGRAPWFTRRPTRIVYARLGDGLVINCNADGVPKPSIVISKIRPNNFEMKGNTVGNIKASHLGIYECKASNKYGVIKYPFLIKIRGGRRRAYNRKRKWKIQNPYAYSFSQWSQWSRCSALCGVGFQTRTRKCIVKLARLRARLCNGKTIVQRRCLGRYCRRRTL